tara:strand:+ start:2645 stop:2896 length:252 start_codon:yes stop_codon:yes gene_type:complete
MRVIKVLIFIFFLTFSVHAFGKSNDYYKQTLAHILTQCNSACQKKVFEQEIHQGFFVLMDAVLNQLSFKLSQQKKEWLWSKSY